MNKILTQVTNIFKFHKKKILFLLAAIVFWFVTLFPYDDLSDYVTHKVSQASLNNVYLQFDGLSFALMPQLGIMMDNVLVETVYIPTLAMKSLGFAPKISSLIGSPGGKLKAYGLFGGDAVIDVGPSNELDIDSQEYGLSIELEEVALKELSKFLKGTYNLPLTMSGNTNLSANIHADPSFRVQPKGEVYFKIKKLNIPSSNLPLNMNGAIMSMPLPALKLTDLEVEGSINDGKLFIRKGKIGEQKDDLDGSITGDIFFQVKPGGKLAMGGYDLKINLNISDNLKRQLNTILTFVDIYQQIGDKYKFDSLGGVRYSMRLTSPSMNKPPRVLSY